jgi:hypothetical protein
VHDGPARGWPEYYYYDELDVTPWVRAGVNTIRVLARHFGIGDFHFRPQRPGLLAQLELESPGGRCRTLRSDARWDVAPVPERPANQPKISIQNEAFELVDARQYARSWQPAAIICRAGQGPWRNLRPRDVASLTRVPIFPRALLGARVVRRPGMVFIFPIARLMHGDLTSYANGQLELTSAAATILRCTKARTLHIAADGLDRVLVNGNVCALDPLRGCKVPLRRGDNLVLLLFGNRGHAMDQGILLDVHEACRLVNPLDARQRNPWVFIPLIDKPLALTDMNWPWFGSPEWHALNRNARQIYDRISAEVCTAADLRRVLGARARQMPANEMLVPDPHFEFLQREPRAGVQPVITQTECALADTPAAMVIAPDSRGDVELCFDLGRQNVGWYEFDLQATAGTIIDLFGVEHLETNAAGELRIQHTWGNRNGLRLICRAGRNHLVSLKRRSGRFLFLTLRNHHAPVRLRMLRLIESTYPVQEQGYFRSSEPELERLWQISNHTLKLCMEDTFTDCPLYEQTHWVGDARNEGLYAMASYGAQDIVRRCIRLTGQSLAYYPIVGAQTPSSWDMLLPAWSFLWSISIWDYYFYSADRPFLVETWPWLEQNLRGAQALCTDQGLFSGPFWNMFDWSGADEQHHTVLHNSMLLVGAIDAGLRCARVLGRREVSEWLRRWRIRLITAIRRQWDSARQAWPDSLHEDGTPSPGTCMHTSFLAILYGITNRAQHDAALRNMLKPPAGTTTIGSPFAIQYYYEALEKTERYGELLASIRSNFLPMLKAGATTVWEQFPGGSWRVEDFPARSHCHGWSAAPLYFLNRVVLGIRQSAPGGTVYTISPWVTGLDWARGATVGARGVVEVSWTKQGRAVTIKAQAPAGVRLIYQPNASLGNMKVSFQELKPAR